MNLFIGPRWVARVAPMYCAAAVSPNIFRPSGGDHQLKGNSFDSREIHSCAVVALGCSPIRNGKSFSAEITFRYKKATAILEKLPRDDIKWGTEGVRGRRTNCVGEERVEEGDFSMADIIMMPIISYLFFSCWHWVYNIIACTLVLMMTRWGWCRQETWGRQTGGSEGGCVDSIRI